MNYYAKDIQKVNTTNINESKRSRTPPCDGNKLEKSFISNFLLVNENNKSPIIATIGMKIGGRINNTHLLISPNFPKLTPPGI